MYLIYYEHIQNFFIKKKTYVILFEITFYFNSVINIKNKLTR